MRIVLSLLESISLASFSTQKLLVSEMEKNL